MKNSLFVQILSVSNIIKCLIGVCLLTLGAKMTFTPGGQGLQVIVGIPISILGLLLSLGIFSAYNLLKFNKKARITTIILSILSTLPLFIGFLWIFFLPVFYILAVNLATIFYLCRKSTAKEFDSDQKLKYPELLGILILIILVIFGTLFFMNQKTKQWEEKMSFNPHSPTREMVEQMDNKIEMTFKDNETAVLHIYYYPPFHKSQNYHQASQAEQDKQHKEFINNVLLKQIGQTNIKLVKIRVNYSFIVELTQQGYKNIKQSRYIRSIELYDTKFYGWP